jgi:hypothetical protein
MNKIGFVIVAMTLAGALPAMGCKTLMGVHAMQSPQSHFAYPNSDVKDLGPVKAKITGPASLDFQQFTAEDDLNLYNTALAQVEGANIILDYYKIIRWYSILVWPYPPIFKFQAEMELEGRAAKMDIGEHMPVPK